MAVQAVMQAGALNLMLDRRIPSRGHNFSPGQVLDLFREVFRPSRLTAERGAPGDVQGHV